jgi:hypothetical protein
LLISRIYEYVVLCDTGMQVQVPKSVLANWADRLYAMGKTIPDERLGKDLVQLARAIYDQRDAQLGDYADVEADTLRRWRQNAQELAVGKTPETSVSMEIAEICKSIEMFVKESSSIGIEGPSQIQSSLSEIIWRSIMLAFTLWYGGQSFSLQETEFVTELDLNHNMKLAQVFDRLRRESVFFKKETGLIVLNPRFKTEVDMAMLFLISFGANLTVQMNAKRGYSSIQMGFIQYSRVHHHPMAYLAENVRSYVSDYCQRVFGRIFKIANEKGSELDYSILRRFLTRLSLCSSLDFVVSSDKDIRTLVSILEDLNAIFLMVDRSGQKHIFLRGEIMNE